MNTPLRVRDRLILDPLVRESQPLTPHGVRVMEEYVRRGYVRLVPALCGPLGVKTGEMMASLTEAGRFILSFPHPGLAAGPPPAPTG